MRKLVLLTLMLILVMGLCSCSGEEKYTIEFAIPAKSMADFVYSDVEISTQKNKLELSAGAGISATEIVLMPAEGQQEKTYEPVILKQGKPVKLDVKKGTWYKIGIAGQNTANVPVAAEIIVKDADVRLS